jgi:hypothetical protein
VRQTGEPTVRADGSRAIRGEQDNVREERAPRFSRFSSDGVHQIDVGEGSNRLTANRELPGMFGRMISSFRNDSADLTVSGCCFAIALARRDDSFRYR